MKKAILTLAFMAISITQCSCLEAKESSEHRLPARIWTARQPEPQASDMRGSRVEKIAPSRCGQDACAPSRLSLTLREKYHRDAAIVNLHGHYPACFTQSLSGQTD